MKFIQIESHFHSFLQLDNAKLKYLILILKGATQTDADHSSCHLTSVTELEMGFKFIGFVSRKLEENMFTFGTCDA